MPKRKQDTAHIVCDPETNGFTCRNCGGKWIPALPLLSSVFLRKLEAFQNFHADCPAPPSVAEEKSPTRRK